MTAYLRCRELSDQLFVFFNNFYLLNTNMDAKRKQTKGPKKPEKTWVVLFSFLLLYKTNSKTPKVSPFFTQFPVKIIVDPFCASLCLSLELANMSGTSSSSSRVSIPNSLRKTIQNLKEIAKNHSDDEIYAMLRECSMDPNETAQKLLFQGLFRTPFVAFRLIWIRRWACDFSFFWGVKIEFLGYGVVWVFQVGDCRDEKAVFFVGLRG